MKNSTGIKKVIMERSYIISTTQKSGTRSKWGKTLLLALFLLFSTTGYLSAQLAVGYKAGVEVFRETFNTATANAGNCTAAWDLYGDEVDSLVITGTWTGLRLRALRWALTPGLGLNLGWDRCAYINGNYDNTLSFDTRPKYLKYVDMSGAVFTNLSTNPNEVPTGTGLVHFFHYFDSLQVVKFPSTPYTGAVSLNGIFFHCPLLETIENLDKLTNVNGLESAFHSCRSLESITLLDSWNPTSLEKTFYYCGALKGSLTIPATWMNTTSYVRTFENCVKLEEITLPPGRSSTGSISFERAFDYCPNLKRVNNMDKFTKISSLEDAFSGDKALESITFSTTPSTVPVTFKQAFWGASIGSLTVNLEGFQNITDFTSAFENCGIHTVTFSSTPQTTAVSFENAFKDSGAKNINLERFKNVTSFVRVFSGASCQRVTLCPTGSTTPVSFKSAFVGSYVTEVVNLDKYNNVTSFSYTFSNALVLESVTLSSSVSTTEVPFDYAFSDSRALKEINNLQNYRKPTTFQSAFRGTALKTITLPATVTYAGTISFYYAFADCKKLEKVYNLDKFNKVNTFSYAFSQCSLLKEVTLSSTTSNTAVTFARAFNGCGKLETVNNLKNFTNVTTFERTFYNCSALESITLPNGSSAGSISFAYAFAGATILKAVDLRGLNVSILSSAFSGCCELYYVYLNDITANGTNVTTSPFTSTTNPNCLKFMKNGTAIPAAWAGAKNFINGYAANSYAYGDIELTDIKGSNIAPFCSPQAIRLNSGNKATFSRDCSEREASGKKIKK